MSHVLVPARIVPRRLIAGNVATPVLAGAACVATVGLGAANGGFYPTSWGWCSLALLWLAIVAMIVQPLRRLAPLEAGFVAVVAGLGSWTWLSVAWSADRTQSILEGERVLVPVAVVAAVFALVRRHTAGLILGGVQTGCVMLCGYALATRLFPGRIVAYDPLAAYRLSTPIGYWNGLGLVAVMGTLLALGFVAREGRGLGRPLAAASLLVLLPTLYFTYSRGAWVALAVGLLLMLVLDPRRVWISVAIIVLGTLPAAAVFAASRSQALTQPRLALAQVSHDGHRYALLLVGLVLVQAALAWAIARLRARLRIPAAVRLAYVVVLLAVVAASLAGTFGRFGGPVTIARHVGHSFAAQPARDGGDLNQRLFNLSGTWRWPLWQAAWREAEAHPLLGDGAGAYGQYWLQHRDVGIDVVDAHNLYLESLAELGPVGLLLVALLFGVPLAAAVRLRRHPLMPAAGAAVAAYAVHAAGDWDWELAGVTIAVVLLGCACVLAGRDERPEEVRTVSPACRRATVAVLALLAAAALVGLLGNLAVASSQARARHGDWRASAAAAHRAIRWTPWSSVGWQQLGEAQLALHQPAAARRSLERAIARDSGNWVLWLDLSAASSGTASIDALARAVELNPLSPVPGIFRSAS